MDKCTVVSILPYEIYDSKPNLYPGSFTIPAGTVRKPGLLEVRRSTFWIPMAFGAPSLPAHSSPDEVANSIVNDYVDAMLSVGPGQRPGLWVEERVFKDSDEAAALLIPVIPDKVKAQRQWFLTLVNMADAEFKKHGQAQSISDLQKLAARELQLNDRPWLLTIDQLSINNCPACYNPVNTNAVICGACKYILQPDRYESMRFATIADPSASKVG